jgi:hypothetical protein
MLGQEGLEISDIFTPKLGNINPKNRKFCNRQLAHFRVIILCALHIRKISTKPNSE